MCYVKTGNDIHSLGDLQVLVSDTVYEQTNPFTFSELKDAVLGVVNDGTKHGIQNIDTEVEKILFSTLDALIKRRLVVFRGRGLLRYIE